MAVKKSTGKKTTTAKKPVIGKSKNKNEIIKLGTEIETEDGVYHLWKNGENLKGRGKYSAWYQPKEEYKGKKYRSLNNWHNLKNGSLGECRKAITEELNVKTKKNPRN